jgi:hypothetical protein
MKRFVFELTSSRSDDVDLRYPVTRSPIGWKRDDSYSQRAFDVEFTGSNGEWPANEMENALVNLAQALRERLAMIRDEQSRRDEAKHIARLRAVSEKIDRLQAMLPRPVDPRLAHYLERKSYDKALELLEGKITANTAPR